ncbi:MAG: 30S ribosomal protein S5 [Puniceicoccales bacterium]|jgi:small subunit ribosomal protein S5|nr:30S ribosomal protein S5 [Puniceicoccales bacterium]
MNGVNLEVSRQSRAARQSEWQDESGRLVDKVVFINRCAKVVKGGRRFSFSALVVVGNGAGRVGVGFSKTKETPDAVKKAFEQTKKNMRRCPIACHTIPQDIVGASDGVLVILRPVAPGAGNVVAEGVHFVLEVLNVSDMLSKSMGSTNPSAMMYAMLDALGKLQ